jgi:hypothetical protein
VAPDTRPSRRVTGNLWKYWQNPNAYIVCCGAIAPVFDRKCCRRVVDRQRGNLSQGVRRRPNAAPRRIGDYFVMTLAKAREWIDPKEKEEVRRRR